MKRVFFVDMENMQGHVMDHANTLTVEDTVILFHNAFLRDKLPQNFISTVKKYAGKVIVENITCRGKNAMDIQICTFLGYHIAKENINGTQFYILSQDKGYADAIKIATRLISRDCETASVQRVDSFMALSEETQIRDNLKKLLVGQPKKVITVTTTAFTTNDTLKNYHIHLQKSINKSADYIYNLTKEYFNQVHR